MKTHLVFLCLIIGSALANATIQTKSNPDKPPRLYVEKYHADYSEFDHALEIYLRVDGTISTLSDVADTRTLTSLDWNDGLGGQSGEVDTSVQHSISRTGSDGSGYRTNNDTDVTLLATTWPASYWPALPNGVLVGTISYSNTHYSYTNNAAGAAPIVWEQCNVAYPFPTQNIGSDAYHIIDNDGTFSRNAQAIIKLETGGKALSQRRNLFGFNGAAQDMMAGGTLARLPFAGSGGSWPSGVSIPSQNITVMGQALGSDGKLWTTLPDNATIDVTPKVAGKAWFTFSLSQQKYTLHILVNSAVPLQPDHVVQLAQFCVGQYLTFTPTWIPSLPSGTQKSPIQWAFGGTFVNEQLQQDPSIAPNGSIIYTNDPNLLKNEVTSAWWISGGFKPSATYTATIGEGLTFPNGQYLVVAASGKFNVFTPTVTVSDIRPRYFVLTPEVIGFYKLGLGETDNTGAMVYEVNYNSIMPFSGRGRITQLCMLNYSDSPLSSFSDYRLDGAENYEEDVIIPGTGKVSLTLQDGPFNTDTLPNRLQGSFEDYVRFRPDAGNANDNIFVTLGVVNWSMNAAVTNSPTISPSQTPDPSGPDNSKAFPFWINTH